MTDRRGDPVFDVLRQATTTAEPTPEQTATARARLETAIATQTTASRRQRRRLRLVTAGATAVLAAIIAVSVLVVRTPRVNAALVELAEATRLIEPTELVADTYLYTTADTTNLHIEPGPDNQPIVYLLPMVRQTWAAADGTALITTTVGQPIFFNPETEAAYFDAGLDRVDRIGQTFTEAIGGITDPTADIIWPTEPDALKEAMLNDIHQSGSDLPEAAQLLELAGRILRDAPTTPALRAAVIDILATLDPLDVTKHPDTTITISTTYLDNQTSVTDTATLNRDGQLAALTKTINTPIADLDVPAGTTISIARYTPPVVVDTPSQAPLSLRTETTSPGNNH